MVKIYKVRNCDTLGEWDIERVKKALPEAEWFIYNYSNGGYDGTGFALWKQGNKYGYTYLGHCSCNGPVEDLDSILYTITEIRKLADKKNYEWEYAGSVLARMKELKK